MHRETGVELSTGIQRSRVRESDEFGHEMPPRNQAVPQLLDLDGQGRVGQHHGDWGGTVAELLRRTIEFS
ncbi:MAG: hypothetical protein CMJ47_06530 [Planctomyces sp.]|nr:hypothetical protein [Planctomyces sp.]